MIEMMNGFRGEKFYGLICVCLSKVVATPVSSHCLFFWSFSKSFLTSASSFLLLVHYYLLATRGNSLLELSLSNLRLRKNFSYRPLYRLSGSSKN